MSRPVVNAAAQGARAFSSTAGQLRPITWDFKGTTKEKADWVRHQAEDALDLHKGLEGVTRGEINGDPHPTRKRDGTVDPLHGSVVFLKLNKPVTSAHVYTDGTVVFSKSTKFAPVTVTKRYRA
ncbi:hypothetical protein N7462_006482 [Penicillium macrosclerotiorum]|uniref:uncharacterized protein n=1 Tax=Penicillium macrosclerotiorum TaxID=303699 RepID=UPI00254846CC|nr:uncharacterized protein N7462_006482 [Penicillium macrosclerotiorum]KAJ5683317.1 hypothetical protein N7462_006482 [Penicillium macrosclerotiorum]